MTVFDIVVVVVIGLSAAVGWSRGATREMVTAAAVLGGGAAALLLLRWSVPFAHHFIHTGWMARAAALFGVFIVAYVILRLATGRLSRDVQASVFAGIDRLAGLAIGLLRGVVVVGLLVVLVQAVTPADRLPRWFTHSKVFPLASVAGSGLKAIAPEGLRIARKAAPEVENVVTSAPEDDQQATAGPHRGYSQRQRQAMDDLVEKSR